MKKHFLTLLTLSASAAMAQSECITSRAYFEAGFGGGAMYSNLNGYNNPYYADGNFPLEDDPAVYGYNLSKIASGWSGSGVVSMYNLGYDHRFEGTPVVLGIWAGAGAGHLSGTHSYSQSQINYFTASDSTTPAFISQTAFFSSGIRLGYACKRFLPFAKIGWSTRKTSVQLTQLGTRVTGDLAVPPYTVTQEDQSQKVHKWINCLLVGAGVDVNLSSNWILGVAMEFNMGKATTFNFSDTTFTRADGKYDTPSIKLRPNISSVMATLKYALPVSY